MSYYLKELDLSAEVDKYKQDVIENFGDVYFGITGETEMVPDAKKPKFKLWRTDNDYNDCNSDGGSNPLYILAPIHNNIDFVWPGDGESIKEVKFGHSTNPHVGKPHCPAICIQLHNGMGLYFCLSTAGKHISGRWSLGV